MSLKAYINAPFNDKGDAKAMGARWDGDKKLWYTQGLNLKPFIAKWPVYLDCPFSQKDQAKAKGAKFDSERKLWYVDAGVPNLVDFATWLPPDSIIDSSSPPTSSAAVTATPTVTAAIPAAHTISVTFSTIAPIATPSTKEAEELSKIKSQISAGCQYNVAELKELLKSRGVKGISTLSKQQLIDQCVSLKLLSTVLVPNDPLGMKRKANENSSTAKKSQEPNHENLSNANVAGNRIHEAKRTKTNEAPSISVAAAKCESNHKEVAAASSDTKSINPTNLPTDQRAPNPLDFLHRLNANELKNECKTLGLKCSGSKAELLERVEAKLKRNAEITKQEQLHTYSIHQHYSCKVAKTCELYYNGAARAIVATCSHCHQKPCKYTCESCDYDICQSCIDKAQAAAKKRKLEQEQQILRQQLRDEELMQQEYFHTMEHNFHDCKLAYSKDLKLNGKLRQQNAKCSWDGCKRTMPIIFTCEECDFDICQDCVKKASRLNAKRKKGEVLVIDGPDDVYDINISHLPTVHKDSKNRLKYVVWSSNGYLPYSYSYECEPEKEFDSTFDSIEDANARVGYVFYHQSPWGPKDEMVSRGEIKRKIQKSNGCVTLTSYSEDDNGVWTVAAVTKEVFEYLEHETTPGERIEKRCATEYNMGFF